MDDWKVVPIGDVAEIFDGPHATPKTVDAGPIFLGIGALENGRINLGETRHVTQADFATWTRRVKPRPRDVVFSYETRLGQVAMIPENFECCLGRRMGLVRVNQEKLDPHFFLYSYLSPQFQEFLRSRTIPGATVDRLPLKDFPSFPISLPPMDVQRSIASLLSSIDDKIELNRRMNETLQAMAQAIFRDWFVDFGPVRRKLEGATDPVAIMGGLAPDPARAAELAGLFPDVLGEDELPVGWKIARIEDLMDLAYGKSMPKTERRAGDVPVYGSGGIGGFHDTPLNAGPGIIIGRKGTVGSLFWEPGRFFAIDTVFYVVPKVGVSLGFCWQLLQTMGLSDMNTDAAVPGLNRSNVYRLETPLAPAPVLRAFDEVADALRAMLDARSAENRTLAETRDYLLPRLMSGEVRVGELEAEVA